MTQGSGKRRRTGTIEKVAHRFILYVPVHENLTDPRRLGGLSVHRPARSANPDSFYRIKLLGKSGGIAYDHGVRRKAFRNERVCRHDAVAPRTNSP